MGGYRLFSHQEIVYGSFVAPFGCHLPILLTFNLSLFLKWRCFFCATFTCYSLLFKTIVILIVICSLLVVCWLFPITFYKMWVKITNSLVFLCLWFVISKYGINHPSITFLKWWCFFCATFTCYSLLFKAIVILIVICSLLVVCWLFPITLLFLLLYVRFWLSSPNTAHLQSIPFFVQPLPAIRCYFETIVILIVICSLLVVCWVFAITLLFLLLYVRFWLFADCFQLHFIKCWWFSPIRLFSFAYGLLFQNTV